MRIAVGMYGSRRGPESFNARSAECASVVEKDMQKTEIDQSAEKSCACAETAAGKPS